MASNDDYEEAVQRIFQHQNDPHRVLNLPSDASESDIKRSYHQLSLKIHPDKNPSERATEAFKILNRSYQSLLSPGASRSNHSSPDRGRSWSFRHFHFGFGGGGRRYRQRSPDDFDFIFEHLFGFGFRGRSGGHYHFHHHHDDESDDDDDDYEDSDDEENEESEPESSESESDTEDTEEEEEESIPITPMIKLLHDKLQSVIHLQPKECHKLLLCKFGETASITDKMVQRLIKSLKKDMALYEQYNLGLKINQLILETVFKERLGHSKIHLDLTSLSNLPLKSLRPHEFMLLSLQLEKRMNSLSNKKNFNLDQYMIQIFFEVQNQTTIKEIEEMAAQLFAKLDRKNRGFVSVYQIGRFKQRWRYNIDWPTFEKNAGNWRLCKAQLVENFVKAWLTNYSNFFIVFVNKNQHSKRSSGLKEKLKTNQDFSNKVLEQTLVIGQNGKETFFVHS